MPRFLFLITAAMLSAVAGWAQGNKPRVTNAGIVYNTEKTLNFRVSTNRGLIPAVEFGKLKTYYKTTFYGFSLGELKHPKEQRQSAPPQARSFRPYVFGKQNNLLVLRAYKGAKRYYSEKAKQKGVAVGISYSFGPSLGLLKPYYLALARTSPDNPGRERISYEKYSEENSRLFLDPSNIRGAAQFMRGLGELGFAPGANASIAYHMDWGAFDEFVKAMEIGLMFDVFLKEPAILVSDANQRFFFNFFVNLQIGKRK